MLPFVNQSGNADDEYFSDGMTDELASALMKVPDLRVAARSSAFTFKGKNADAREVGAKLNVATVLEGTVRRSGPKLRVTAQLVNTSDGLVRWAERYERETKDVFAVQDDITGAIVSALQLTLGANVLAGGKAGRTDNAEAHDLYLRGRFLVLKQTEEGLRKSLDYFAKALEKDPRYAPAYAGTALAHMWLADAFLPPREAEPKAKAAALKAIELDSTNAEAHTYLGLVKWFYDWEFENFELEFRRALQLNPNSMEAHNFYALALCAMTRWDEGIAEADRAMLLDPLAPMPSWTREVLPGDVAPIRPGDPATQEDGGTRSELLLLRVVARSRLPGEGDVCRSRGRVSAPPTRLGRPASLGPGHHLCAHGEDC